MDRFQIRLARPEDLPVLYALLLELAEYEKLLDTVKLTEENFGKALFESPSMIEAILADMEDESVGFALFYPVFPTFLGRAGMYLEDIFVRPACRGLGIGKKLLSTVTRISRDRGLGRVDWAVLDWNEPAQKFYRSLGARPKEGWTVYQLVGDAMESVANEGTDLSTAR
ncbi:GNAT family N-acetyltransferase [bacterium]|nr:GNAT family N-acetyltransferase [bacterium]